PRISFFFYFLTRRTPRSRLFPYTTLFRSFEEVDGVVTACEVAGETKHLFPPGQASDFRRGDDFAGHGVGTAVQQTVQIGGFLAGDRKSTRLNSSHVKISYAVFCLKKKKQV